jgi:SAM-dependent methyltransferase
VVGGIPILTRWARNSRLTLEEALARHRSPPRGILGKILRRLSSGAAAIRRILSNPEATFFDLAGALGRTADLDYFRYRFSDLSYISTAALLTPISGGPVLDLGCGAGHLLHALSRKIPSGQIVGLDLSFTLLYLARRFLVPDALLVCADASSRLPFRDGAFEAALCADMFNYLPDRELTARELMRVARGPLLLSRLADPAFRGGGAFAPLEPQAYLKMFAMRSPHLYLDRHLLEEFLKDRSLDLAHPADSREEVMTLTAGVEPRLYPRADFFVSGSTLNPIYDVRKEGDRLHLRRRLMSRRYTEVCRAYDAFLPETLEVTQAQIATRDPDLVRRFVLLDLPPRYC